VNNCSIIWTEDVARLVPFYRDTLGQKMTMESDRFVMFGDGRLSVGQHSEVKGAAGDPYRIMSFETTDAQADYDDLIGKGVEFTQAPYASGTLKIATFKDPDGNILQLLQRNPAS
jgi:predicted enzyme related to lactoylglutathione lyase